MNTLEAFSVENPWGITEECAKFVIDSTTSQFMLSNIATIGREYTLSFWVRAEAAGRLYAGNKSVEVSTQWERHIITFEAAQKSVMFLFQTAGTYYIYHPQLEVGNKATDWRLAPEDVDKNIEDVQTATDTALNAASERISYAESTIQQLADSISSLIRSGESGSLVHQDENGLWYFDISGLETSLSDTANDLDELNGIVLDANGQIDVLKSTAAALQARTEYIRSYTDENDQPCLELGEGDSVFKVVITNTEIKFMEDTDAPAKINRKMLVIEKTMIKNELQFGDDEAEGITGVWIWKRRASGNLGLSWKAVSS